MKFFALIFLFGLATASFHDILDNSDEEDFLLKSEHEKKKDDLQTELGRKLRKTLDHILKEIKQAVEDDKGVSQELLDMAKDLVNKLKRYGFDVSNEAKDIVDYLKTRAERWAEELLDILSDNSTSVHRADDRVTESGNKLKEKLRDVLREIKKAVEEGKRVSQRLLEKAKDLITRIKKYGLDISEEIKDMLEYLKTRISKWAEELLSALRGKRDLMENFRRIIQNFGFEKVTQDLRKMLDGEEDVSSKVQEFIKRHFSKSKYLMRKLMDRFEEGKDKLKTLLDKILGKKETRSIIEDMKKKLEDLEIKEKIEKLKEMIKEGASKLNIKKFIKEIIPEKYKLIRDYLLSAFETGTEHFKQVLKKLFP